MLVTWHDLGKRSVVLSGARIKCVSNEHGSCLKERESPHLPPKSH